LRGGGLIAAYLSRARPGFPEAARGACPQSHLSLAHPGCPAAARGACPQSHLSRARPGCPGAGARGACPQSYPSRARPGCPGAGAPGSCCLPSGRRPWARAWRCAPVPPARPREQAPGQLVPGGRARQPQGLQVRREEPSHAQANDTPMRSAASDPRAASQSSIPMPSPACMRSAAPAPAAASNHMPSAPACRGQR
jgi:hypothetical protein